LRTVDRSGGRSVWPRCEPSEDDGLDDLGLEEVTVSRSVEKVVGYPPLVDML
jgi:hypothetical protein